jgi:hypothetical protein
VKEYGVVEAEGTPGYGGARVTLRAPRMAVRVESGDHWQSKFALAMWMAASYWGGYGFIYLPRGTGGLHPALARVLAAYDPDHLVDALWTHPDMEALEPGWHARHVRDWPTDPVESAALLAQQPLSGQVVSQGLGDDLGLNLCSPYYQPFDEQQRFRRLQVLSCTPEDQSSLAAVLGGQPQADFEIPAGLDPLLTLALGMRAGYPSKPPLPVGKAVAGVTERLPHRYVHHALSSRQDRPGLELRGLTTAWDLTQAGLVQITRFGRPGRPVAVIGSTAEDFALAIALDRIGGPVAWVPIEWTTDPDLKWPVQEGYRDLLYAARSFSQPPVVTSISLSDQQLREAVEASWPEPIQVGRGDGAMVSIDGDPPEILPAHQLDLGTPTRLACGPGDYGLPFTSPTRADGLGGFEFLLPLPANTPSNEQLRGPRRPFWEVDVEVHPPRMPSGRNLRGSAMLADDQGVPMVLLRSGRDGITFHPLSMGLVPGGATLEQSIATPQLRILGLRGWVKALVAQDQPEMKVQLSQAGRRAMILTRLWGSRSAVAQDLRDLNDFLREFKPSGSSDNAAYGDGDGVRLTPAEGYLTAAAATRTLPSMKPEEVRDRMNHLLHINVLQRGLIVPCSECERRAFYRIELLGETNVCPRCGAPAYTTAARRSAQEEPEWFYDLHGAVRELLDQNGDVPFLAGKELAASARSFEDIAELDFCRPDQRPTEIDILALADDRLTVGEAKCVASLGTAKATSQAIGKLLSVSDLLGADEILLATTAPDAWKAGETAQLLSAVAKRKWRYGKAPQVRVLTNLRGKPRNELLGTA